MGRAGQQPSVGCRQARRETPRPRKRKHGGAPEQGAQSNAWGAEAAAARCCRRGAAGEARGAPRRAPREVLQVQLRGAARGGPGGLRGRIPAAPAARKGANRAAPAAANHRHPSNPSGAVSEPYSPARRRSVVRALPIAGGQSGARDARGSESRQKKLKSRLIYTCF